MIWDCPLNDEITVVKLENELSTMKKTVAMGTSLYAAVCWLWRKRFHILSSRGSYSIEINMKIFVIILTFLVSQYILFVKI